MSLGARPIRAAVITVSDKGYAGERVDESGPALVELLRDIGAEVHGTRIVPDDQETIEDMLSSLADGGETDLILTSGGTGLGPRDRTPEATRAVMERPVPGFPEAMRAASLDITPRAMLSRATSGVRGETLIINMPGSPKACREVFSVVAPALPHAIETLTGRAVDCAETES